MREKEEQRQHICFDSGRQSRRGREPLVNPLPVAAPRHGTFPERANVPPTSGNRHKGADPAPHSAQPKHTCPFPVPGQTHRPTRMQTAPTRLRAPPASPPRREPLRGRCTRKARAPPPEPSIETVPSFLASFLLSFLPSRLGRRKESPKCQQPAPSLPSLGLRPAARPSCLPPAPDPRRAAPSPAT